jgi:hypothetical protein
MGWRDIAHQMGIRHYYNFSSVLWIPWRVLTDELRYQHDHHALYMNAELWSDAEGSQLSYWILARVLWDVDADVDALFDDYVSGLYGIAAEPMRRYYARLTDAFSYGPEELLWPRNLSSPAAVPEHAHARGASRDSRSDLREARMLARGDETLDGRVRISEAWLDYMTRGAATPATDAGCGAVDACRRKLRRRGVDRLGRADRALRTRRHAGDRAYPAAGCAAACVAGEGADSLRRRSRR